METRYAVGPQEYMQNLQNMERLGEYCTPFGHTYQSTSSDRYPGKLDQNREYQNPCRLYTVCAFALSFRIVS